MKKIIFRKLLIDCLSFFLMSLFVLSIIIWIFQAVNYLDIIIEDGRNYLVYLKYSFLNFPKIISKILPFAIFLGFFYTLVKYELNNQLIIFWTYGVQKIEIIKLLYKFSFILIIIQIFLVSLLVPKTQEIARSIIKNSNTNSFENFLKPKKFNDGIKGLTIFSESKDIDNNLINIYLKKETSEGNFQITYAKKGKFIYSENFQSLILFEGQTINFLNNEITSFKFSRSDFNLSNMETNTTTYIKTQENTTIHLFNCILNLENNKLNNVLKKNLSKKVVVENCSYENYKNIVSELYKRIILPFYIPILILTSLLLILFSKEEISFLKYRVLIFLIGLSTIILSEMSIRYINTSIFNNLIIFLIPFTIIIIIYSFLRKKLSIKYENLY